MSMSTTTHESAPQIEINTGSQIRAMAFTANGKYLVSGDKEAVRLWRVADGQQMVIMKARDVRSVAVSKDGKWIAAGKSWGETTVWDRSQSFKEVFKHDDDGHTVTSVDFSPDATLSTRLVIASGSRAASIWDIATHREVVGPLKHQHWVIAAKFSPRGERIATATRESVRVYDSRNGSLLADIPANVTPYYNTGLLWSNEYIVILSKHTITLPRDTTNQSDNTIKQINNQIKQINASSQSISPSEWSFPPDSNYACIVLSKFGIICCAGCTVTLCDSSTPSPPPLIQLPQDAHSIALSPTSQLLAIGGGDGKIVFKDIPATIRAISEVANLTP